MTHYAVLVAGDNVAAALAPFEEHAGLLDPSKPYLVFDDKESEIVREYTTGTIERIVMPDGTLKAPWDDEFVVQDSRPSDRTTFIPEHLERREVPVKELYASVEDYAREWHGLDRRDPDMSRYGYWVNPVGKWDWYRVGGDYAGRLKLRPGPPGLEGVPLVATDGVQEGYADSAYFADLDLEGMRVAAETEAAERYDRFHSIVAGRAFPVFAEYEAQYPGDHAAAREAYWGHPILVALREHQDLRNIDYQAHQVERDTYVKLAGDSSLMAYALVVDGVWYSRRKINAHTGESIDISHAQWYAEFLEVFNTLAPDTIITMVDCHT